MRRTTFISPNRQEVFDMMRHVAEENGFDILYADRFHLEVEAMKGKRVGSKKHLSLRIIEFKNSELEVNIEVRNMGLELKRNKKNDLLEAKIERMLLSEVRLNKKNTSAA